MDTEYIEEQEIHLRDYLRVMQKRKSTIILFFLITLLTVILVTLRTTPVYEASSQILVEKNEGTPLMGNIYYNPYDPEFYETQHQLIKSNNVAHKVVSLLQLEETYDSFFPKKNKKTSFIGIITTTVKEFVSGLLHREELRGSMPAEKQAKSRADVLAEMIQANIKVTPVKESRILNISYQSENPKFAALVTNAVTEAYQEELMAIQLHASGYALKWMTSKADEVKKKLAAAEEKLQQYMQKNNIITVEDKVAIVPQRLSELTSQLSKAETEAKEIEAVYQQAKQIRAQGGNNLNLPELTENKAIQDIQDQIRKAEQHVIDLSQKFGPKHPVMVEARTELAKLKKERNKEIDKIIVSLKHQAEIARAKATSIREELAKAKQETLHLNERLTQYNILKREVETNKALYSALMMRMKEKGVTEKTQKVNVYVTQAAEIPEFPVKPKKLRNILLGMILGLFGGIGMAFFLEYLDNTVKSPDEVERRFQVGVLGVFERLTKGAQPDKALVEDPASSYAEGFKGFRTSLLLSSSEKPPRKILITSAAPQEGKTTTAVNLAISLSQAGNSVIVVDTDMRRPRVHKVFGFANNRGLSLILAGAAAPGEMITRDDVTGVHILTSGPIPPNPAELIGSPRFPELVDKLSSRYDFVIFDSPPLMSAAETLVTSKQVDGTILSTYFGKTTYEILEKALKSLHSIDASVLGVVINAVDNKQGGYNYYYGYYTYTYETESS